jgi:hypothetical protein
MQRPTLQDHGGEHGSETIPLHDVHWNGPLLPHTPATIGTPKAIPDRTTGKDYRYPLLPDSKTHIRLLSLVADSEAIVGTMQDFPINEAPEFCALSYAWGDEPKSSFFMCDGGRLAVTSHLLLGIQRVRNCNPTQWIWVDAVCINQRDDEEKAHQIPTMDKIYSHATRVLVWLGETTEDVEQALGQFASLRDRFQAVEGQISFRSSHYVEVGLPEIEDPIWKQLSDFMCCSWFQRLWVLQEVILAKHIDFICGGQVLGFDLLRSLSLEVFRTGVSGYVEGFLSNYSVCKGFRTLVEVGTLRDEFSNSGLNSLYLLNSGRRYVTREPVDKVYGLLGIMKEDIKQVIVADYSKEARDQYWRLYLSVGKLMIELGYLDILMFAETSEKHLQLPSWAPDWSNQQYTASLSPHFHAGICPENDFRQREVLVTGSNKIRLRGFQLGTIIGMSDLRWMKYEDDETYEGPSGSASQTLEMIDEAFTLYQENCNDVEDILLERFSRTLVADSMYMLGTTTGTSGNYKYSQDPLEDYKYLRDYLLEWKGEGTLELSQYHVAKHVAVYAENLPITWRNRSFFVTDSGRIGLCSRSCEPGDVVCIFLSLKHTYTVRKRSEEATFELIGAAYTDGVMYGEALEGRDTSKDKVFIIH